MFKDGGEKFEHFEFSIKTPEELLNSIAKGNINIMQSNFQLQNDFPNYSKSS
jgi:hypothetical protein